jgi:hypothetical protein
MKRTLLLDTKLDFVIGMCFKEDYNIRNANYPQIISKKLANIRVM